MVMEVLHFCKHSLGRVWPGSFMTWMFASRRAEGVDRWRLNLCFCHTESSDMGCDSASSRNSFHVDGLSVEAGPCRTAVYLWFLRLRRHLETGQSESACSDGPARPTTTPSTVMVSAAASLSMRRGRGRNSQQMNGQLLPPPN